MIFHKLCGHIHKFETIRRQKIMEIEKGFWIRKIRSQTKEAHDRIYTMCNGFSTMGMAQKKERIVDFCVELGTVRNLTGAYNPDNSFNVAGLPAIDNSFTIDGLLGPN